MAKIAFSLRVFECVCVCVTHQSRSSPLRILVGSSSCSRFPVGCIFLHADMGLSRRAPPRLRETDGWEVEEGLGSYIRELISRNMYSTTFLHSQLLEKMAKHAEGTFRKSEVGRNLLGFGTSVSMMHGSSVSCLGEARQLRCEAIHFTLFPSQRA